MKLKNDREMVSKSHIRKMGGIHRKSLYRKEIAVNHEVILPELIESDEEYESDSESEHPYNEDGKQANHTAIHGDTCSWGKKTKTISSLQAETDPAWKVQKQIIRRMDTTPTVIMLPKRRLRETVKKRLKSQPEQIFTGREL